jgi:hypothetical protein
MEKVKIELTEQEVEMVYTGLLELVAKYALPLIHNIRDQVALQKPKEIADDEGSNKSEV